LACAAIFRKVIGKEDIAWLNMRQQKEAVMSVRPILTRKKNEFYSSYPTRVADIGAQLKLSLKQSPTFTPMSLR
jgi:hypothetical protein